MGRMTLKQLRYFEAVVRHRHFGRAADACAISQPALSMQIKELEETLGAALFERGRRDVGLTGFGQQFDGRVRDILRSVDELEDLARATHDRLFGRLRIGVIPTVAPYLLPRFIAALGREYPELEIHVRETLTAHLLQDLRDGRIDTAIVALPVSEPTLTEIALFKENFVLVRPASDADKPVPDKRELREMRLLLLEEGHCFRDQALSFCNMSSTLARDFLDGSSLATLVQMVGAGIGVTLIPDMAVPVETRSATVSIQKFKPPRPSRTIGMIWRKRNPLADSFLQIADLVREAADDNRAHHLRHAAKAAPAP